MIGLNWCFTLCGHASTSRGIIRRMDFYGVNTFAGMHRKAICGFRNRSSIIFSFSHFILKYFPFIICKVFLFSLIH